MKRLHSFQKIILIFSISSAFLCDAEPEFFQLAIKDAQSSAIEKLSNAKGWNEVKALLNMAESYFSQNPKTTSEFLEQIYTSAAKSSKSKADRRMADQRLKVFKEKKWDIQSIRALLAMLKIFEADAQLARDLESFEDSAVSKWNQLYMAALRMQKSGNKDAELLYVLGKAQFRMSFSGAEELREFLARATQTSPFYAEVKSLLASIQVNERN